MIHNWYSKKKLKDQSVLHRVSLRKRRHRLFCHIFDVWRPREPCTYLLFPRKKTHGSIKAQIVAVTWQRWRNISIRNFELTTSGFSSQFVHIVRILDFYKLAKAKITNLQMISIWIDQKHIPEIHMLHSNHEMTRACQLKKDKENI